ncbi:hypothetical protein TNCT_591671 [Trichonephila clavata]|uniref:Uncharacterized protein n=1 Tax=Trichonephila clavata TaxID=2740835 RepID=A0A8X6FLN2_TRICU|nr:hypothetical protein TNCT_591671 [Trichonephila clavata]
MCQKSKKYIEKKSDNRAELIKIGIKEKLEQKFCCWMSNSLKQSTKVDQAREKGGIIPHGQTLIGENATQAAEIVSGVHGSDTVTANYVKFRFH